MNNELLVGLATLAIPLFAVGYLMLHRKAAIFRMYSAMLVLGLGYLALTGALSDIGRDMLGTLGVKTTAPAETAPTEPPAAPATETPAAPPPAPAAESPAPETPAPAPEAPKSEPAPATP